MKCVASYWGMRDYVCLWRVLNNLYFGRVFYDSIYNFFIGLKLIFIVDVFELM